VKEPREFSRHNDYAGGVIQSSLLLYRELQDRRVVTRFAVFRDFLFTTSRVVRGSTQRGKKNGPFFLRLKWPGHEYCHVFSRLKTRGTCLMPHFLIFLRKSQQPCLFHEALTDYYTILLHKFKVCKSVLHHTIQINQPTRCNNFSSLLLVVYVQLNMFRASSRPSSGAQQLQ